MMRRSKRGDCGHCRRRFNYYLVHNGFGDCAYAYCDACGTTAIMGGWDDHQRPPNAPLEIQGPILVDTEPWLSPCSCGGHFRRDASPRCPSCLAPLSAEEVAGFIERNAEGTRIGWSWQRSWLGVYAIIIEDRRIDNPWRQPPVA